MLIKEVFTQKETVIRETLIAVTRVIVFITLGTAIESMSLKPLLICCHLLRFTKTLIGKSIATLHFADYQNNRF